ncbi:hypothetical protein COOONC_04999, partial [Cooperia oncophora]
LKTFGCSILLSLLYISPPTRNHPFSADSEFAQWPWTAAVIKSVVPSPCGIVGKYTTPKELRSQDCYNVTVDCENQSIMEITASHCSTDVAFDSRQYQCIASWRDGKSLYLFALSGQETQSCFVAEFSSGRLHLASTGPHCSRDFNFSQNAEKTIVLEEEASCTSPQKLKPSRKPAGSVAKASSTVLVDEENKENTSSHLPPIAESAVNGPQWTSGPSNVATSTRNILLYIAIFMHCIIFQCYRV